MNGTARRALCGVIGCLILTAGGATASETRWWTADTAAELLKGRGDGVAVTHDGRLLAVAVWNEGAALEEPVVMAADVSSDRGLIVGTGHPARLYRVEGKKAKLLAEVPGEQITTLLVEGDGAVLVATMAPAVLYRWRKGDDELREVGRLGAGGFWDLAKVGGTVVAAAGPQATLYRVTANGLVRWVELPDVHARCLAADGDAVIVGTSGKGLILSVDPSGMVALLADSAFTEISDLVVAADGSVWAAAVVGEPVKTSEGTKKNGGSGETSQVATVDLSLPKVNGTTASSEVVRLTPEGALLSVHRFTKQVASAVAWDGAGVLVGTGFEGEVWRFVEHGGARLSTIDAVQVTAFVGGGSAMLTQGPAGVRWRDHQPRAESRFRAAGRVFPRPVRFGEYRVEPETEGLRIRFRSGASEKPDDSWLPWSDWLQASGRVPLPPARSLQWELEIVGDASARAVERVEVSYREVNLAPRIESVEVAEPGVVYLAGPPPSGPVIDAVHPDFSGIFTVIDPNKGGNSKPKQGKKFWRVGYRTLSWKAKDPNEDPMRFLVEVERADGFRLKVRERLKTTQLALDTTAVPDGRYRFRIVASDELRNPGAALEATATSHWFAVDNTLPSVSLERRDDTWHVVARDDLSPLVRAEWSRDGDGWQSLAASDGLLDGRREEFTFPSASGRHLVVVRVIDRHHNRVTVGGVEE